MGLISIPAYILAIIFIVVVIIVVGLLIFFGVITFVRQQENSGYDGGLVDQVEKQKDDTTKQ